MKKMKIKTFFLYFSVFGTMVSTLCFPSFGPLQLGPTITVEAEGINVAELVITDAEGSNSTELVMVEAKGSSRTKIKTEEKKEEKKKEDITVEKKEEKKTSTSAGTGKGVLNKCGLTEEELKKRLRRTLKDYAGYFLEAEEEYGINAAFLASVAALESGWGESNVAKHYNNLFGWTGSNDYVNFDSVHECILTVAKRLKTNYLTPGGSCFHGYDIEDINVAYNGSESWLEQVIQIYKQISR